MIAIFQCVAEAVGAKGFLSLASEIPFGNFLIDVASDAWKRLKGRREQAQIRADVEKIAQAAADEIKQAAREAAKAAIPDNPKKAGELELFLTQIPSTARQSFRRTSDPTGRTVPPAFALNRAEDLLQFLPAKVSPFHACDPLPGREGWTLTELLGSGGFGEVWLAKHPRFGSLQRAVKFCTDLTARDRVLLQEAEVIDRVMQAGTVPHVVSLIDAHLEGDVPWLMYEYVPGGDLVSLVGGWKDEHATARRPRAIGALKQIATAVAHFHKLGVVHRDLKPANVLALREASRVTLKVADFGIGGFAAKRELEKGAAELSTAGRLATIARGTYTPAYASPQQKSGASPDPRDDVFALGVIGYQLLTGDVTRERPGGKAWRRTLLAEGTPPALLDLLEASWDDSRDDRPAHAGVFLTQLIAAVAEPKPVEGLPLDDEPPSKQNTTPSLPQGSNRPRAVPPPLPTSTGTGQSQHRGSSVQQLEEIPEPDAEQETRRKRRKTAKKNAEQETRRKKRKAAKILAGVLIVFLSLVVINALTCSRSSTYIAPDTTPPSSTPYYYGDKSTYQPGYTPQDTADPGLKPKDYEEKVEKDKDNPDYDAKAKE